MMQQDVRSISKQLSGKKLYDSCSKKAW